MAIWNKDSQAYLANNKTLFEAFLLADKDGNVINSFGVASNIPIAAGLVDGYGHINKFGATDGDVSEGTVWDGNDGNVFYPYPAAGTVSVTSASNSGASVEIQGLDENYVQQTVTTTIGGTTTETFSRVFRARMVDTNNDADVTINQGGALAAKIIQDFGQTLMSVYTIPAGKTGYLIKWQAGSDKASTNASLQYRMKARPFGGTFNVKGIQYAAGGQNMVVEYPVPLAFAEKTDLKVDAIAASGGQTISSTFDIILVDNEA